jgi:pimeloyl-ACP methyl ester carboxylesterase
MRASTPGLLLLAAIACRPDQPPADAAVESVWRDPAPHAERFVDANGVRLHVLDWGGTGPALVLIHGYGDTPHIFDDFVPALGGQFRVVAYARRGHGRSSSAEDYSNAALAGDLIAVMDSLGIARASLAGWSMGGNEITAAAGMFPDRVDRIIYLDAGYDWSDPALQPAWTELPISLDPTAQARVSLDGYRAWVMATWFPGLESAPLEAHIREAANPGPDGVPHPVPDSANSARAFAALLSERRDYTRVRAPALSIYSEMFLSQPAPDSTATAAIQAWEAKHLRPFRAASQERMRRELKGGVEIVTVPGSHATFMLVSRDTIASAFRSFLSATK